MSSNSRDKLSHGGSLLNWLRTLNTLEKSGPRKNRMDLDGLLGRERLHSQPVERIILLCVHASCLIIIQKSGFLRFCKYLPIRNLSDSNCLKRTASTTTVWIIDAFDEEASEKFNSLMFPKKVLSKTAVHKTSQVTY